MDLIFKARVWWWHKRNYWCFRNDLIAFSSPPPKGSKIALIVTSGRNTVYVEKKPVRYRGGDA